MKIAVLTSGGDSAGMNAVVRGVVRAGIVKFVAPSFVLSVI
jgi:6-phosphofructokinase